MRTSLVSLFALLVACGSDKDGGTTDTSADTGGGTDRFAEFVNVQTAWTGDTTCFQPNAAGDNFVEATPDPTCQVSLALEGTATDFQTDEAVADATVQVWSSDDIEGDATTVLQADADGNFGLDIPSCAPFAYGVTTPVEWEETVDTFEVHQVYGYSEDGADSGAFNSVSQATSRLIPALIGVEWDPTTAIIAGTAYDCAQDPIQYAQIYLHDADGNPPATGDVFYFSENAGTSLPTRKSAQPHTNTNGLWVAMNIPAGTWTVEMWGWDAAASQHVVLGRTELQVKAGGVTISNVYTGDGDGIYYPASCLEACGG